MIDHILYSSAALIALTNPLAELPFFLAATAGSTPLKRRQAAAKVAVGVLGVLVVAAIAGTGILALFLSSTEAGWSARFAALPADAFRAASYQTQLRKLCTTVF